MRQSPWPTGLQSSFIIWTLLRSSFTGCNPELAIHSSLKLLHCISCSWTATFSCPECNIDSRFSTLDYRILLVQGFGNETSTKTIAGKLFGKMVAFGALPVWCSVYHCQTVQQNARKIPPVLEKIRLPKRCDLVTYSWCSASGLFSLLPVVGKVHAHIIAL